LWFRAAKKQSQTKPNSVSPQTCAGGLKPKMKKQSQFVPGLKNVSSFMKGVYGNNPPCGLRKNKANSKPIGAGN
jgi:hypothetical protein